MLGLDRPTTAALKALFRERRVQKRYLAMVHGRPSLAQGVIDLPLGRDTASGIRVKMGVVPGGHPSRTHYRVLETCATMHGELSLVEAFPETGRQHQIRAHLHAVGLPVVGDKLYGPDPALFLEFIETGWTESLRRRLLLPRQALHAADAIFPHPMSGEPLHLTCPLPPDLAAFWKNARTNGALP